MNFPPEARLAGFTIVDTCDPAELDERSEISRRLPGLNATHTYKLRDRTHRGFAQQMLLSRYAMRSINDLQLSYAGDRFASEVGIVGAGMGAYCFGLVWSGRMALSVPERHGTVELGPGEGPVHGGLAGMRMLTADSTVRTNIWISSHRFDAALRASLGETPRDRLLFAPRLDWSVGVGASLQRLLLHAAGEFARPGGLADNAVAAAAFIDLFVHTALRSLPHNHADRLARSPDGPAPLHLRRAEAYIHAHAHQPLRLEDAAREASCSVRTLQRAFVRFRGTTAHAAMLAARLRGARAGLREDGATIAAVARRYGFTHSGRFAVAYARQFGGETPSETLRRTHAGFRGGVGSD